MTEYTKETVRTNGSTINTGEKEASNSQTTEYLVYFVFGVLEVLLSFRLFFKLAGASHGSYFVSLIYSITSIFIIPFKGIFRPATAQGVETTAIFEPSTFVAIIVYVILAWGITALVRILSGKQKTD